jgi:predicted CXXCH cytochrome family protein
VHGPEAIADIASCTACHGADYNGNGFASMNCNACHTNRGGWNANALTTNCTFCHGTKTKTGYVSSANPLLAAPPEAVDGNPASSGVGAHQAHLTQAVLSTGYTCVACHAVPPQGNLPHIADGAAGAEFVWGALAARGTVPTWNPASLTCTNYCHGATLNGGTGASPAWTATTIGCTSCHGMAPSTGQHSLHVDDEIVACFECHTTVVTNHGLPPTISATGRPLHVNGAYDVALSDFAGPGATWDPGSGTCTNIACHGASNDVTWR